MNNHSSTVEGSYILQDSNLSDDSFNLDLCDLNNALTTKEFLVNNEKYKRGPLSLFYYECYFNFLKF